ncbi:hypothetical protein Tsubulata_011635, partial [Turnera subulata]
MSSSIGSVNGVKPPVPPPSPIPTGKGSRSAANKTLADYLDSYSSLQVPDLVLPHSMPSRDSKPHQTPLPEIDYRSLESVEDGEEDLVLWCARGYGVFGITGHGISDQELRSLALVADQVVRGLQEADGGFKDKNITWGLSGQGNMELARDFVGAQRCRDFSEMMENLASKLDALADRLCKIIVDNLGENQLVRSLDKKETILSLHRCNHDTHVELNPLPSSNKESSKSSESDHALCLYIPSTKTQFLVQSPQGPLSFDVEPHTIVVTMGKPIMEGWSLGDFKSFSGEVICKPLLQESQGTLLIELKCLPANTSNRSYNTISIRDQILIGLILTLLYNIIFFFRS